ncbi:MAG: hypothetical protein ACRDZ4_01190 [Egibacteraceae bacterium]
MTLEELAAVADRLHYPTQVIDHARHRLPPLDLDWHQLRGWMYEVFAVLHEFAARVQFNARQLSSVTEHEPQPSWSFAWCPFSYTSP